MKKSITYDNIENVKYEFTEQEVLKAICKAYDIVISGKEYEFDIYEGCSEDDIEPHADLVVYYKTRVERKWNSEKSQ